MAEDEFKAGLQHYLQQARDALLWKLEGLSEYDLRRPLVPTGTNLLGLVKHLATTEAGYFGQVFGRPCPDEQFPWPWPDDLEDNVDMYATADESSAEIIAMYRRVNAHSDQTIEALPLDATGTVPWWREEHQTVTLHRILIHMIAELNRHVGHADLAREMIDGAAGHRQENSNMPPEHDQAAYRARLETIALGFR
ncbi:DinB family protein [Kineosporia babensis]|uniref:DinB family protein n=1 Tax=Kineosporia babensis TaxID=499548 RepID=A0A9X1NK56_9ACTN|nr:DinB family protein [Kineosporia babensis]MCD5315254.1 DinB family protein [Kineosporia babensis]